MKNTRKANIFGSIVFAMLLVFGMAACGDLENDDNSSSGGNGNGGKTEKTVDYISVHGSLAKTNYYVGDTFDPTGLTVKVTYTDYSQETITTGFTWDVDMSTKGSKVVGVTHTASGKNLSSSGLGDRAVIYVYPTADLTQADFYGIWEKTQWTVTISENSVILEQYGNHPENGTYTISNWGEITKTTYNSDDLFGNYFEVEITSSTNGSYSVKALGIYRNYNRDELDVAYGTTGYYYITSLTKKKQP